MIRAQIGPTSSSIKTGQHFWREVFVVVFFLARLQVSVVFILSQKKANPPRFFFIGFATMKDYLTGRMDSSRTGTGGDERRFPLSLSAVVAIFALRADSRNKENPASKRLAPQKQRACTGAYTIGLPIGGEFLKKYSCAQKCHKSLCM